MSAEQVLMLLDSFWFETTILTNKSPSNSQTKLEQTLPQEDTKLLVPTTNLDVRFYSEQNLSFTGSVFSDSPSPNSVLTSSKLGTIPSEREIIEFSNGTNTPKKDINNKKKQSNSQRRRRRKSRSLSELEFQELKGFMDLGFVFSEEDKDSTLASLIPGLQRLGKEDDNDDEKQKKIDESVVSDEKPYLSEAWDLVDLRGRRNPLVNWRVPEKGSEIDMKHNLKFWAHTVASIVG